MFESFVAMKLCILRVVEFSSSLCHARKIIELFRIIEHVHYYNTFIANTTRAPTHVSKIAHFTLLRKSAFPIPSIVIAFINLTVLKRKKNYYVDKKKK